jgi:hypothetical protein
MRIANVCERMFIEFVRNLELLDQFLEKIPNYRRN